MIEKIFKTMIITYIYGVIWILLEVMIYGQAETRIVDDIMMTLFMPIIYLAVNNNFYK